MVIYMATNKINGKKYVGQTINTLEQRKVGHVRASKGKKYISYFHKAIRKYGIESFGWEIIHTGITNIDDLNKLEIFYIGYYDTFKNGYNLTLGGGGNSGCKVTEATKRKISKSMCGENHPNYGKKMTVKQKQKISEAKKGRFTGKDNPNYGNKWSNKQKKNISNNNKGKFMGRVSPNAQPVVINNKYFDTVREASEFVGVTHSIIRWRILHKTKWLGYRYINKPQ